jgi:hypothetical protein
MYTYENGSEVTSIHTDDMISYLLSSIEIYKSTSKQDARNSISSNPRALTAHLALLAPSLAPSLSRSCMQGLSLPNLSYRRLTRSLSRDGESTGRISCGASSRSMASALVHSARASNSIYLPVGGRARRAKWVVGKCLVG